MIDKFFLMLFLLNKNKIKLLNKEKKEININKVSENIYLSLLLPKKFNYNQFIKIKWR
jgi:hypothetical protein